MSKLMYGHVLRCLKSDIEMSGICLEEKINNMSESQAKFVLISLSKSYYDVVSIAVNFAEKDNRDRLDRSDIRYITNKGRLFS